jgi:hypothetical protein
MLIRLENTSRFSARNPMVRLTMSNALINSYAPEWTTTSVSENTTYQWSGGSDISIHGFGMTYELPPFGLVGDNSKARTNIAIAIDLFAEGFRLPVKVPVRVHPYQEG